MAIFKPDIYDQFLYPVPDYSIILSMLTTSDCLNVFRQYSDRHKKYAPSLNSTFAPLSQLGSSFIPFIRSFTVICVTKQSVEFPWFYILLVSFCFVTSVCCLILFGFIFYLIIKCNFTSTDL